MDIGKINIDFQVINSYDPAVLLVGDFSNWLHIEDKPAIIEVILPGASQPISFSFVKNTINALNGSNLQLGCRDCDDYPPLPDGIYDITVKGSPDTFKKQRYYLKIDQIRLELDKIWAVLDFQYQGSAKPTIQVLNRIEAFLRVSEAHTRLGNIAKAKRFFDEAEKLINKYKECKNCY